MLYQSCWNNLVTGLIVPTSLLQFVNGLFQTCSNKFGTSSANTSCQQLVNRLVTTCLQVCSNLCVFTCVYQSCWNNLVTGLIVPSSLLQFVNSLFQTCSNKFGTSSANTSCQQLVNRLVTTCLQVCSNLCVFTCVVCMGNKTCHTKYADHRMKVPLFYNKMTSSITCLDMKLCCLVCCL